MFPGSCRVARREIHTPMLINRQVFWYMMQCRSVKLPTFRRRKLPPSSRPKQSKKLPQGQNVFRQLRSSRQLNPEYERNSSETSVTLLVDSLRPHKTTIFSKTTVRTSDLSLPVGSDACLLTIIQRCNINLTEVNKVRVNPFPLCLVTRYYQATFQTHRHT
jgi:hypothetical protein